MPNQKSEQITRVRVDTELAQPRLIEMMLAREATIVPEVWLTQANDRA
ncbi:MAG TPA: hypothetical protein PKM44_14965 [Turneriella sp.]|nr:hypothetical protein [Turneriella sp.]HNA80095.1 hypothetical protein [Turneriella sp.]HNE21427.1 hypothetical protein [Turneriella sp.]HNJ67280.1 hypothetical protein [Turneriella sp.]HNL11814.1 hypothetical protein [Turneriella sp.]